MKILVIGGTGLIGSKVVSNLKQKGHEVLVGTPKTGVDAVTGQGLDAAMAGTDVVIDVANSPSFEDKAVLEFFEKAGENIAKAEQKAGIKHHVALSVVGTEKLGQSGYFRGKQAQERIIKASGIPYTIIHSTQFFEFMSGIAQSGTVGNEVHVARAFFQPIVSDEVAAMTTEIALGKPANEIVEIAGPEKFRMNELVEYFLKETKNARTLVADNKTPYFGAELTDDMLIPGPQARLGKTQYKNWLPNNPPPQ